MSIVDHDDELAHGEEIIDMAVPDGFQLQMSPPPALDVSLVNRGARVRRWLGWFGEVITRKANEFLEAKQAWVWRPCDP